MNENDKEYFINEIRVKVLKESGFNSFLHGNEENIACRMRNVRNSNLRLTRLYVARIKAFKCVMDDEAKRLSVLTLKNLREQI